MRKRSITFQIKNVNWHGRASGTVGRDGGLIGYSEVRRMYPTHALKMGYSKAYWARKGYYQIKNLGHAVRLLLLSIFQTTGGYLLKDVLPARRYHYSCINGLINNRVIY